MCKIRRPVVEPYWLISEPMFFVWRGQGVFMGQTSAEARSLCWISSVIGSHLIFETGSVSGLSGQLSPRILLSLLCPVLRPATESHHSEPQCLNIMWVLVTNLGIHACTAYTVSTEPSPQSASPPDCSPRACRPLGFSHHDEHCS